MPDKLGRIKKGEHLSRKTEFKKGKHWRPKAPYWDKSWLREEYATKKRTLAEIASEFGISDSALYFWARKHGIKTRTTSETRAIKKWGLSGKANGMYGRRGNQNPRWLGGVTPERQSVYSSREWMLAAREVWKRDKGVCQRCGETNTDVHLHHIVSFAVVSMRCAPDNIITLCVPCHRFVHSKKNKTGEFIKEGGDVK